MGKYHVTVDYEVDAKSFDQALEFAKQELPEQSGEVTVINLEVSQLAMPVEENDEYEEE